MEKPKPQHLRKQHKKKDPKKPFWKQFGPEIESITTHIGKAADNMTHSQWSDIALNAALAFLSYDAFAPVDTSHVEKIFKITSKGQPLYSGTYATPAYPNQTSYFDHWTPQQLASFESSGWIIRILSTTYPQETVRYVRWTQQQADEYSMSGGADHGTIEELTDTSDPNYQAPSAGKKVYSLNQWPNALVGPIGLKLAQSFGGTPPVSQIAGLVILADIGLIETIGLGAIEADLETHLEKVRSHRLFTRF
jgi:hypothetical protein